MFIFFLIILLVAGISLVAYSLHYGISPMPSTPKAKKTILSLIPKEMQGLIVELGSGWGTLAFPLARDFPQCPVYAYEISPLPWFFSKSVAMFKRYPNLTFFRQDFFQASLADAALVVCYLYPGAMQRLKLKFEQELKPGALVISNTFAISGWKPIKTLQIQDLYHTKIYLYQIQS